MSSMFRSVCALLAGVLVLGASVIAAENAAGQASEQTPPGSIQGTTAAKGPQKMFQKEEKADGEQKEASKDAEKKAKEEKEKRAKEEEKAKEAAEKKAKEEKKAAEEKAKEEKKAAEEQAKREEKAKDGKKEDKRAEDGKKTDDGSAARPVPSVVIQVEKPKAPEVKPEEPARTATEVEAAVRSAIGRLSTSGWREAQAEIIAGGKISVPLLIDAMSTEGGAAPAAAYNLGGHTKADTGRATRQRPLGEVCAELLTEIVSNHSNYKGELPPPEQKAWREWWAASGASVTFAN